jgi:hypothetical protein
MAGLVAFRRRTAAFAAVSLALVAAAAPAASGNEDALTRIRFDELAPRPVNGLHFRGVAFQFRVVGQPSRDAVFGGGGPGSIRFVQDPSLEGDARGVLTLRFAEETEVLRFGAALNCFECTLRPGFVVRLFDEDELVRVARVTTRPFVSFTEARFAYAGEEIDRAVIRFNARFADRFALDNLVFESAGRDDDASAPGAARVVRAWR